MCAVSFLVLGSTNRSTNYTYLHESKIDGGNYRSTKLIEQLLGQQQPIVALDDLGGA